MARIVALLDSMWGWGGYNEPGQEVPRFFHINPDNHSGRRLYQLCGEHDLMVTNSCRTVQTSANDHGKPDRGWVRENLRQAGSFELLLIGGLVARKTFASLINVAQLYVDQAGTVSVSKVGSISYLCIDHPAARRWSRERIAATAERIAKLCSH